ncbi:hypothetical protein [Paraburkholderia ginsengiterrae]
MTRKGAPIAVVIGAFFYARPVMAPAFRWP